MDKARRSFLRRSAVAFTAFSTGTLDWMSEGLGFVTSEINRYSKHADIHKDDDFWQLVKQAYTTSPNITDLNNGGVCPQPRVVQEAVERYNRLSNEAPSYYMWRILDQGREPLREHLAEIGGCDPEEIAINRNACEGLETIIFGLRLREGDEVVLSKQDYPNMINAWKQRAHREGIVLKWVDLELPSEDDAALAGAFTELFSERTKVVHITHVINWNGQVLPVRQIADEARERDIDVLVDGAHAFAHLNFRIDELNCDYYGTSLHKWLCAPFGSGMLYVRREKIKDTYPLLAAPDPESEDIRKFEHLGTRSFAVEMGVGQACAFHDMIGSRRKFERLHYLKTYWTEQAAKMTDVVIDSPVSPERSGAIAIVRVGDKSPGDLKRHLFSKKKIHTTSINWENIKGVRITPNVYTLKRDLDRLLEGIDDYTKL